MRPIAAMKPAVRLLAVAALAALAAASPVTAQERPPEAWLGPAAVDSRQIVGQPRTILWSYVDRSSYWPERIEVLMLRRGSGDPGATVQLYRPDRLEISGCDGPRFRLSGRAFRQMRGRLLQMDLVATTGPGRLCDTRRMVVWFHQQVSEGPEPVFESWQVRADLDGRPTVYGPDADLPGPDPNRRIVPMPID